MAALAHSAPVASCIGVTNLQIIFPDITYFASEFSKILKMHWEHQKHLSGVV